MLSVEHGIWLIQVKTLSVSSHILKAPIDVCVFPLNEK